MIGVHARKTPSLVIGRRIGDWRWKQLKLEENHSKKFKLFYVLNVVLVSDVFMEVYHKRHRNTFCSYKSVDVTCEVT